jgi:hypothetical protein
MSHCSRCPEQLRALAKSVDGGGDFGSYTPNRPTYFSGIEKASQVREGD